MHNEQTAPQSALQQIKEITPFLIQVGTVVTLILGAYLAYNLRPLYEDIRSIRAEVKAIQDNRAETLQYIPRFIQTEQKVTDQGEQLDRIENKLDRLIERTQ